MTPEPDIEEMICDYLDGQLSAEQRTQFEQQLARDPELRKTLERIREARDLLRGLPAESLPQPAARRIAAEIRRPRWLFPLKLAAAILFAITLGLATWTMLPSPQNARPLAFEPTASTPQAPPAPLAAGMPLATESQYAQANPQATLFIRSADIPALRREIDLLLGAAASSENEARREKIALQAQGDLQRKQLATGKTLSDAATGAQAPSPAMAPPMSAAKSEGQSPQESRPTLFARSADREISRTAEGQARQTAVATASQENDASSNLAALPHAPAMEERLVIRNVTPEQFARLQKAFGDDSTPGVAAEEIHPRAATLPAEPMRSLADQSAASTASSNIDLTIVLVRDSTASKPQLLARPTPATVPATRQNYDSNRDPE